MTHLNEKYEQLIANYEELCQVIMEMRSQIGGISTPSNWPHGFSDNQPPPLPPPTPPLF
jgi:hypothetical protein